MCVCKGLINVAMLKKRRKIKNKKNPIVGQAEPSRREAKNSYLPLEEQHWVSQGRKGLFESGKNQSSILS
jgi:hypothetical protein